MTVSPTATTRAAAGALVVRRVGEVVVAEVAVQRLVPAMVEPLSFDHPPPPQWVLCTILRP